jgi:hypothetical protein
MLLIEFVFWWYLEGWGEVRKRSLIMIKKVQLSFSIPVLLKTLFSPWKQIVAMPGRSLDDKFRSLIDNLISRTVGFFVRVFSLIAALFLTIFTSIIGLIMVLSWPLIPVLLIYCIIKGVTG